VDDETTINIKTLPAVVTVTATARAADRNTGSGELLDGLGVGVGTGKGTGDANSEDGESDELHGFLGWSKIGRCWLARKDAAVNFCPKH
jgi:hypothetical protein